MSQRFRSNHEDDRQLLFRFRVVHPLHSEARVPTNASSWRSLFRVKVVMKVKVYIVPKNSAAWDRDNRLQNASHLWLAMTHLWRNHRNLVISSLMHTCHYPPIAFLTTKWFWGELAYACAPHVLLHTTDPLSPVIRSRHIPALYPQCYYKVL